MTWGEWVITGACIAFMIWTFVTVLWGPSPIKSHRLRSEWRSRCPHQNIAGIQGDRINHVGGYRLQCLDCDRYLRGPVTIANYPPEEQFDPSDRRQQ